MKVFDKKILQKSPKLPSRATTALSWRLCSSRQSYAGCATFSFTPHLKTSCTRHKNYFQALKIYNQALKIYNQTLKIYFQALKIILYLGS